MEGTEFTGSIESEVTSQENEGGLAPQAEAPQAAPEMIDLDSTEKFKFQGREWTSQELRNAYLRHEDYTRKTQEIAEDRKYYDNLHYDLDSVRSNPALAEQFKSLYPEKFHRHLEQVLNSIGVRQQPQQRPAGQGVDPQFMARFNRIEQELNNQRINAINAELDAKFSRLSKVYPFADEEAVVARAQYLVDKGTEVTDKVWDSLWKMSNERSQKIAEAQYLAKLKEQKTVNQKSKDVPAGGGVPAPSGKIPRSIKEASEMARRAGF